MKILYVHNEYSRPSGEEQASGALADLLVEHGHEVRWFKRCSSEIDGSLYGKTKALVAGIYNPWSAKSIADIIDEFKPDVVQVQNLYPLISSSIFKPIKERGIPVVMRCPNYRLFCPQGLSLDPYGNVCERCWNNGEINCVKLNCMGSRAKSIGYAVRNSFNRKTRKIFEGVDVFIVQSEFQKNKFIGQGISADRIGILPGISPIINISLDDNIGEFVSFVGRVSSEKGIYEFIEAARMNPGIPFKVAGNLDANFKMPEEPIPNLEFVGFKKGDELDRFYQQSRIIVVPSKWYEGFPNVIVRGMLHGKPVITSDIGAMQSIIDHKENGLLVAPGDSASLGRNIGELYNNPDLCRKYGEMGKIKAESQYSRESIYYTLMDIYSKACNNSCNL